MFLSSSYFVTWLRFGRHAAHCHPVGAAASSQMPCVAFPLCVADITFEFCCLLHPQIAVYHQAYLFPNILLEEHYVAVLTYDPSAGPQMVLTDYHIPAVHGRIQARMCYDDG